MFYFATFGCYLLGAHSFLKRDRKGVGSGGERSGKEVEGVEGGKTVLRVCDTRKESV